MMEKLRNNKWFKIGLLTVAGLVLAGAVVWAGIQIGKQYAIRDTQYARRLTSVPELTATLMPTSSPEALLSPLPSEAPAKEGDETAGWKSYTNTKYGYSIKYPKEESRLFSFTCEPGKEYSKGDYRFRYTQPFDLFGLQEATEPIVGCGPRDTYYLIEIRSQLGEPGTNELEGFEGVAMQKESIVIDGTNGIKAIFTKTEPAPVPDKWVEILLFRNGKRFDFTLSDMNYETIFDLILSTFKFLD